jgi:hypothetical protein
MPYRRLPNTDLARIYALEKAVENEGYKEAGQLVLSYQTIRDASTFLPKFKRAQTTYAQCYDQQARSSKDYRPALRMARLYLSHFIQVLNMAIQRGELRQEIRSYYGMNPENLSAPNLLSEAAVYEWGAKVIKGEDERIAAGGVPIYNPTIAKVKVHYNIFADLYYTQKMLQQATAKATDALAEMRPMADTLILDIWNQVEHAYQDRPMEERLELTGRFGVIYYYRSTEKARIKAQEMQGALSF